MPRRWVDSVLDAVRRVAARHATQTVRRSQLVAEELPAIIAETDSEGRTPGHSLSRTLQELRDKGVLVFAGRGVYRIATAHTLEEQAPIAANVTSDLPRGRPLVSGEVYPWASLGDRFGFDPNYLGAAGGMISRPKQNTLLIITHPGGARSFDYGDYWDNRDLIYAGRGKVGDQKLDGQNRDLANRLRKILVFEPDGTRHLRYIGNPHCVEHWWTREPDQSGQLRRVLRYRLRFDSGGMSPDHAVDSRPRRGATRRARAFDTDAPPPAPPRPGQPASSPEERAQLLEQATKGHHSLIRALVFRLEKAGWTGIQEIPGGLDLWATKDGRRVIFEAKTLRDANAAHQVRVAIAQLLEYRFHYGESRDGLCLVTDAPLTEQRVGFLESLSIGLLIKDAEGIHAAGTVAASIGLADE
jgi:hypothetical protein